VGGAALPHHIAVTRARLVRRVWTCVLRTTTGVLRCVARTTAGRRSPPACVAPHPLAQAVWHRIGRYQDTALPVYFSATATSQGATSAWRAAFTYLKTSALAAYCLLLSVLASVSAAGGRASLITRLGRTRSGERGCAATSISGTAGSAGWRDGLTDAGKHGGRRWRVNGL